MNLMDLYPGNLGDMGSARMALESMRLFLVRTNMVSGQRFALGWRGVAQTGGDGWTAKIRGYPGVFGFRYHEALEKEAWRGGVFRLAYFPSPEEGLLENVSLAAAAVAHQDDYHAVIRDFTAYPDVTDLFAIGRVDLLVHPASGALTIGLRAPTRDRILARHGIQVPIDGQMIDLVRPGEADRDFPSFRVAYAFFETLAASVTFNWQAPPCLLAETDRPGFEQIYDRTGSIERRPAAEVRECSLWLGYGVPAGADPEDWPPVAGRDEETMTREAGAASSRYPDALWRVAHRTKDIKSIDKQALGIDERPSLIVLTGFLGSGKTSFLRNFIEYQVRMNRFVAVIQNEIGAVGLDGKLMADDVAVTEMDEGCVCCSLIGNLKTAVNRILADFQPDAIVLETTGLANPFNLLDDLGELDEQVRFDSVTTVIDAADGMTTLDRHAVAEDQIRAADILLINKIDLVDEDTLDGLKNRLAILNPRAALLTASQGDIPPGLLYGTDPMEETIHTTECARNKPAGPRPTHDRDGIRSLKIEFEAPLERQHFLDIIMKRIPPTIIRIKGVIDFVDNPAPIVFQYVGGRYDLSAFDNSRVKERFLVFIGTDLDPDGLQALTGGKIDHHPHHANALA